MKINGEFRILLYFVAIFLLSTQLGLVNGDGKCFKEDRFVAILSAFWIKLFGPVIIGLATGDIASFSKGFSASLAFDNIEVKNLKREFIIPDITITPEIIEHKCTIN
uniref:Uncharacterized protein n=1 Tax=Megaselia scalaris TaxID=36166 RepID=T1GFQ7_MEGSC